MPPPPSSSSIDGKSLVLEATDIVKLIGETVQLKRAGRRYSGLCPFHNEKSPSFSVDPTKQFFYCFGCKASGNAIDFVMQRDHVEFKTALHSLADWANVELPKYSGPSREQTDRMQQLRDACSQASALFQKKLREPAGKAPLDYMLGRGFEKDTLDRFGVGFAPDAWNTLEGAGLTKKFGVDALLEAGLLKRGDRGVYDTFRDRVVFPIRDEQGRPIAFGGRILPGSDNPAKYLNSPETPLFHKSKVLFGLDLAKKAIVETKTAVVFEGYADAAMAHQFGITNAVAVLGTALTAEHAQTLRRLADKVVLVFDADTAGGLATRRSVELFLTEPVEIAVADLPAGSDPDEFLQQHGAEAFPARLSQSVDVLTYQWRRLLAETGNTITGQQQAVTSYLRLLADARADAGEAGGKIDDMRWGAVLARVSRLTGMPTEKLHARFSSKPQFAASAQASQPRQKSQWRQTSEGKWTKKPALAGPRRSDVQVPPPESAQQRAEAVLLGALFCEPSIWHGAQAQIGPNDFADRRYSWLADEFWSHLRNEGEPSFAEWLDLISAQVLSRGSDESAAARARDTCIELTERAEQRAEQLIRNHPGEDRLERLRRVASRSVADLRQLRERGEVARLVADARESGLTPGSDEDDIERLRRLQEQVKAKVRKQGRD